MEEQASQPQGRIVVVAMDGSKHSDEAFQWYIKNIYKDTDHVVLVHAPEYRNLYSTVAPLEMAHASVITQLYKEEEQKVQEMMETLKTRLRDAEIGGKVKCEGGEPGQVIVKVAHEMNANLIVTGCRGLGTIRRTFMGSVSDYVLHHSDVPVVVCRHGHHHGHGGEKQ